MELKVYKNKKNKQFSIILPKRFIGKNKGDPEFIKISKKNISYKGGGKNFRK